MSEEGQSTQGLDGPDSAEKVNDTDTLFKMLLNFDPETDDMGPIVDLLFGSGSRTPGRTRNVSEVSIGIESRVLKQIANFCATRADLLMLFGPVTDSERAAGATSLSDFPPMTADEIDACLEQYMTEGLIEAEQGEAGEPGLYIPTSMGMRRAGFVGWNAGISERHGGWLIDRGGRRGRLGASIAAAVCRNVQLDHGFEHFTVWSLWEMRRAGRRRKRRYLAEIGVPRHGERAGHRHYPAAIICPKPGVDAPITLIEIFDGWLDEEEMEIICRGWTIRRDVFRVNCYVTDELLPRMWEIVRRLNSGEKIAIYRIPQTLGAKTLVGLQPEQPPRALTTHSELTAEDEAAQLQLLKCLGEAGSASVSALAEYLELEEAYGQILVEIAEQKELLSRSSHVCDGAHLFWLTKAGVEATGSTLPAQPSSFRQARFENDCLRIAARVRRRFPGHTVMNARQLRLAGESMPVIGGPELGCAPGLLAKPKKPSGPLVAVLVAREIGTITELEQMVKACAAEVKERAGNRGISLILIYAAQALVGQLKGLVQSHAARGRIEVKRLPTKPRAPKKQEARAQRSTEPPATRPGTTSVHKQIKKKEVKAPKPRRCELHVPQLPGLRPVGDAAWEVFRKELDQRVRPPSGNSVSIRLVVNVAIWLIENNMSMKYVDSNRDACMVGGSAFTCWLARLHHVGLWEVLQDVIQRHEPGRGDLKWERIDPARYKHQLVGQWRKPSIQVSDKQVDDTWEEIEKLRLEGSERLQSQKEDG